MKIKWIFIRKWKLLQLIIQEYLIDHQIIAGCRNNNNNSISQYGNLITGDDWMYQAHLLLSGTKMSWLLGIYNFLLSFIGKHKLNLLEI